MIRSAKEAREIIDSLSRIRMTDKLPARVVYEANGGLDALRHWPEVKALADAVKDVIQYLEERGIRTHGTIGRTKILPALDEALAGYHEATK